MLCLRFAACAKEFFYEREGGKRGLKTIKSVVEDEGKIIEMHKGGKRMDEEMRKAMDDIVEEAGSQRSAVITILQQVQGRYRYLPEEALRYLAEKLDMSPTKIFGIATFYENFSLEKKGKYIIRVCDGTACHVRKSTSILNLLYRELGLSLKKNTTEDFLFTVETVSCLGACGLAPVMTVNDKVYGKMTQEALRELLAGLREVESRENQ